ncbi:Topoisomerase DNA binding C4 zinc finger [Microbulbifer donghaiensis]|uniref:Topoisomerase DNA binding C4 zinc finger n=1 Tax=Microbulbifer donghaiensis TaxID=494016 RepID=A0A1M5FPB8_9GAMM|nr:NERD domain-containing protein [Microbulbifer donghaiensis]SHF93348.1 Topoisomerase DNA binding C4 zinc finger [Microbulbifer donghaiensis]
MNFDPLINQALSVAYWLLPIALIAAILKNPWFKGIFGEALVTFFGWLLLPTNVYQRIHNVTLQTQDGTTQIDHIFVSRFGIFVVETKNMQGWILGGEHQAQWTQRIYKKSFKFQNPLRQNYKHVKSLQAILNVPQDTIHSVVVFAGNSTFKTPMPANVTKAGGYIRYIKSFQIPVLTESQVQAAVSQIQSGRLAPTRETHRQHVQQLEARNNPNAERLCPKCGNQMIKRTSKRGSKAGKQFWGCSAFPQCKTIQPIN